MRMLRYLTLVLTFIAGPALPQGDPTFLDVDRAFRQLQDGRGSVEGVFGRFEDLLSAGDNFNIIVDGLEIIRRPDIPVVLNVNGDWGDFTVRCNMTLQFVRRALSGDNFQVEGGVWGGVLEFGYAYQGEAPPDTVTTFDDDYEEGSFGTYAAGDFLLAPDCGSGSHLEPDYEENPRIAELNEAQLACADALIVAVLVNPNGPPPPECVRSTALLGSIAEDIGLQQDTFPFLERCILEQAASIRGGPDMSTGCVTGLRAYNDRVEAAFGLCDLEEIPNVALSVIDPRPEQFKARYTYDYQRSDCKALSVSAYINAPPPELFALTDMAPAPDECLSVEYVAPGFRVTFSEPIRDEDLESKVRLQLSASTILSEVPVDVVLSAPNQIDIAPQQDLRPENHYILSLKTGINGLRSTDDAELEIGTSVVNSTSLARSSFTDDFEPVTWFHTTPFSDIDPAEPDIAVRAGVYQVARDADLVRSRATATRIWFDWPRPAETQFGRQPIFCAQFEVRDQDSGALLYDPLIKTMKPTDDYTDDDRLYADDTANLFNWRPTPDTDQIVVSVQPAQYWHAPESEAQPPLIEAKHDVTVREEAAVNLTFKYGYLEVADFKDGIGTFETGLMARHMDAARRQTWQMGPFGRISVENLGSTTPQALGISIPDEIEGDLTVIGDAALTCVFTGVAVFTEGGQSHRCQDSLVRRVEIAKLMTKAATEAFAKQHCGDANTVCFLFVPALFSNHSDFSSAQTGRGIVVTTGILGLTSSLIPQPQKTYAQLNRWIGNGDDLAHEVGHSYGLYHVPLRIGVRRNFWEAEVVEDFVSYESDGGRFPGIDGVRMHPSGSDGTFKSSEHGNPDNTRLLAPLMFPQVLPTGSKHVLNAHYDLWLERVHATGFGRVFGIEDRKVAVPDPNDAENTVGPLPENRVTYTDMRRTFINSNLAIFDNGSVSIPPGQTAVIGSDRDAAQDLTDGITTSFVALEGDAGMDVYALTRPTRGQEAPVATGGADLTLTALAGAQVLTDISFAMDDSAESAFSVFLPLAPAEMQQVTQVVLRKADGTALVTHDIPALPATDSATLSQTPDGLMVLTWDSAGTAASVIVGFAHEQDGQSVLRSIGSGTDTGRFVFDPAMTGVIGSGTVQLTFDNGVATRTIDVPATLSAPFAARSTGQEGPWDQPELVIGFNRAVAADLPAFTLMQAGAAVGVPLAAVAVDDTLFVQPQAPLAPCTTYTIQTDTPLLDAVGNPLRAGPAWALNIENATRDCPQPQSASLTISRDARAQISEGSVEITGETITLSFDRQIVVLAPASLRPGTYGLANVGRGETRQVIVLDFSEADTATDRLTLTQDGPALSGSFTATLAGGRMEGRFTLVP